VKRRIKINAHDHEKDEAEIEAVQKVEEKEHDRNGNKQEEYARSAVTARIQEEHERDPVDQTLDVDRQMHEPSALFLTELANRKAHDSERGHDSAEERKVRNHEISVNVVIHTKIDAERNDD
jgi:hypothetical protein